MDQALQDTVVLRRVFPAEVTTGDQVTTNALVLITRDRVYAWAAKDRLVLDASYSHDRDLPHEYQLRRQPLTLTTDTGTVVVNRGRGCGCGNPLKGWQPLGSRTAAR